MRHASSVSRSPFDGRRRQGAFAALLEPRPSPQFTQPRVEAIGDLEQVARIILRVGGHCRGQRPACPVGLLRAFGELDTEFRFHERGIGELAPADQARGEHGIENRGCDESARTPEQAQIVIRAVKHNGLALQGCVQRFE